MVGEPCPHLRVLVGGVVVDDRMDQLAGRHLGLDGVEEADDTGCIECNSWRSNKRAFIVELSVEDIRALRGLETSGRKARSVR